MAQEAVGLTFWKPVFLKSVQPANFFFFRIWFLIFAFSYSWTSGGELGDCKVLFESVDDDRDDQDDPDDPDDQDDQDDRDDKDDQDDRDGLTLLNVLTMIGMGREMMSTPTIAQHEPTIFPGDQRVREWDRNFFLTKCFLTKPCFGSDVSIANLGDRESEREVFKKAPTEVIVIIAQ